MPPLSTLSTLPLLTILLLAFFSSQSYAIVPFSRTFQYKNEGSFGEYSVEYAADYRILPIEVFPFTLCFYNIIPNAFFLALRMGHRGSESIMQWVWEANRAIPVHEGATLKFGQDGNLVLTEVDGTVAWQTGTANKGVIGLNLLQNGNLALYDSKGGFIWQSFDHPTDTLLVDQSLRFNGPKKLVNRASVVMDLGPIKFGQGTKVLGFVYG